MTMESEALLLFYIVTARFQQKSKMISSREAYSLLIQQLPLPNISIFMEILC